ncbi:hypothetical protein OG252_26370 [Streptomyces sp. NBC_01352]|jgi:hypothetical protein|uniref:hypothetical protein n=1 Tax=Streptomyces sp. NBC_01352 TaxID=2903834 RepID=UPI002E32F131|nr:hypothetical protein [Streptomyces sp. NBC_01352]
MPRRNRNVATVRPEPAPNLARALQSWTLEPHTVPVKPSAKRRRFRVYGGAA